MLGVTERRACWVLGQAWAVQRYTPIERDDEGTAFVILQFSVAKEAIE